MYLRYFDRNLQADLDLVDDLRENVKVLKAELQDANGRAASLENNALRQQVAQASGADRRKVSGPPDASELCLQ